MFVGHYSAALAARAVDRRLPLGLAFLAAQWVDVVWAILGLAGVERLRLDPTLPSNALVLEHMPYTHSLVATVLWSLGWLAVGRFALGSTRLGVLLALTCGSHWIADVLVHRPDMTLAGGEPRLGLGLWNYPVVATALELVLLVGTAFVALRGEGRAARRGWILVGVLAVLQVGQLGAPPPPSTTAVQVTGLVSFLVFALWAHLADPRRARR